MDNVNIEAMNEILNELNIKISDEKIKEIVKDYDNHLECMKEIYNNQFISYNKECNNCKKLEKKIKELEDEIFIYNKSVKERRNATNVYINKSTRQVLYDL